MLSKERNGVSPECTLYTQCLLAYLVCSTFNIPEIEVEFFSLFYYFLRGDHITCQVYAVI